MRYLYRSDDNEEFAYAKNRRDFFRTADDTLWAHESHDWLVAAKTGVLLAHRTGNVYYDALTEAPLYYEKAPATMAKDIARAEHLTAVRAT